MTDATQSTPTTRPRLLLAVDGNSFVHRAHHAAQSSDMRGPDGKPTWAAKTFMQQLLGAYERFRPDAVLIGFDRPGPSRRRGLYPEYKAGRAEKNEDLRHALNDIPAMLTEMGLTIVCPEGEEADDVMASAAADAAARGWRTIVATSDRDAFALVNEQTAVLRVTNGGIHDSPLVTRHTFREQAKCQLGRYSQYAALRGDKSDNLPGAPGFGEVTAAKLVDAFETVADAWQACDADRQSVESVIGKAATTKLQAPDAVANVTRNLQLMEMRTDIPVPEPGTYPFPLDAEKVTAALTARGLATTLRATLPLWCGAPAPAPTTRFAVPPPELDIPPTEDPHDQYDRRDVRRPAERSLPMALFPPARCPSPRAWPLTLTA